MKKNICESKTIKFTEMKEKKRRKFSQFDFESFPPLFTFATQTEQQRIKLDEISDNENKKLEK